MRKSKQNQLRRLRSDQLGEKGEARFTELCVDAGFNINKFHVDRTGKDFLVEYPEKYSEENLSLDVRPQPHEFKAQVKTVWQGNNNVKLRLSSAQRLAKLEAPAFLFVLEVTPEFDFSALVGIHVYDDFLETILKKLRDTEPLKVNRETISFAYRNYGELLDVSGEAIKRFVDKSIGPIYREYTPRKIAQLNTMGYSATPLLANFTMDVPDEAVLADIALGVKSFNARDVEIFETRWGIPKRVPSPTSGPARFTQRSAPGQLRFRDPKKRLLFDTKVKTILPTIPLPPELFKIGIEHPLFSGSIEETKFTLQLSDAVMADNLMTLSDHDTLVQFQRVMATEDCQLTLSTKSLPLIDAIIAPDDQYSWKTIHAQTLMVRKLQYLANYTSNPSFLLRNSDLYKVYDTVHFLYRLARNRKVNIHPLKILLTGGASFPKAPECLLIGQANLGDSILAYYAIAPIKVTGEKPNVELHIGDLQLRQIEILDQTAASFALFEKTACEITGLNTVLRADYPRVSKEPK